MTDRKLILTELIAARLRAEGLPTRPGQFVDELRPLAREILDRDEAPVMVSDERPTASPQSPWEGFGWMSGKWVAVWYDGTTWRRNNSTGNDVTLTITYWRQLQAP